MIDSPAPAAFNETLPGRWVSEPVWPPKRAPRRLFLAEAGLVDAGRRR